MPAPLIFALLVVLGLLELALGVAAWLRWRRVRPRPSPGRPVNQALERAVERSQTWSDKEARYEWQIEHLLSSDELRRIGDRTLSRLVYAMRLIIGLAAVIGALHAFAQFA